MGTKTSSTSFFGLFNDGYKATDDKGHTGYGPTKETANDGLKHSQEVDSESSSYASLIGWRDTPKK